MASRPYDINDAHVGWQSAASAAKRLEELVTLSKAGRIDVVRICQHSVEDAVAYDGGNGAFRFWDDGFEMQVAVGEVGVGGILRVIDRRMATDVEYKIAYRY